MYFNRVRLEVRRLQRQLSVRQSSGPTISGRRRGQGELRRGRGAGCAATQHQSWHGGELKVAYCVCAVAEWPAGRHLKQCKREIRNPKQIKKFPTGRKENDATNLQMPRGKRVLHYANVLEHSGGLSRGRRPSQKDVPESEEGIWGGWKKPDADG